MVTEIRSGIPTTYEASRFRSRLEARWAAFFDLIGWSWVYEPFDANGYIPDFLITGKSPFLVEVGPCATPDQYREKASKALSAFPQRQRVCAKNDHLACIEDGHHPKDDLNMGVASEWIVLVLGVSPTLTWSDGWANVAGYLTDDDWGFGPDIAGWARCRDCGTVGVHSQSNSYRLLPCGDHDGDHHLGYVDPAGFERLWREAGNTVQWNRR